MAYEYDHDCPFEAFITNLGKYNEGELVGEWVKFPTTSEELQKVFERIGIGSKDDFGNPYEEWFISDYDCYVDGLYEKLGEYENENLDELNYLASKLNELDAHDYNHFQAAMQISDYTDSIKDVINLIDNLDKYEIYPGVESNADLGHYYIEELGMMEVPDYLADYIDYEAYGRDVAINEMGQFTDYGYGAQSQQFAFYRIPKVLFTDNRFQNISTEGKVLYGLLLDRVSLSMENGWIDDEGRVYIIFTLTTIRQAMNCAEKSAIKYLTELEEFGLIERIRQGFGKPALIYVKNFIDQQNLQVKTSKNYSSPPVKVTGQDLYNLQPNYTYNNNTDFNNTNPILSADEDRMRYEKYFMEQLNIEALKQDYPYDREMIDGIMDLILDVVCSKRKIICIAGDVKSVNVVKGRFMKLNMEHIRYVMNCMQENTTKIRSIKQYMLAALYNAPATIDSYYRAEVNHDMAEGKI